MGDILYSGSLLETSGDEFLFYRIPGYSRTNRCNLVRLVFMLLVSSAPAAVSAGVQPPQDVATALIRVSEQQDTDEKAKKAKKEKVVCKRVKVTGTHFRQRICRTQAVWEEIERESQRAMDELTRARGSSS
ncbi:MAG: hypothetical protein AAF993_03220 [Pseudomonadota bacterium]